MDSRRNNRRGAKAKGLLLSKSETSQPDYSEQYAASSQLVVYRNPQRRDPFPPRYRTTMYTGLTGSIAAAASAVRCFCRLNCALTPFSGGGWQNPVATLTTLQPTGYSSISNVNFYQRHRVLSSRISVKLMVPDASETMGVSISPSFLTTTPATYQAAIAEQYTKARQFNVSSLSNGGIVSNSVTVATLLGVPASAVRNDLSGNYVCTYNTVCAIPCFWVVNFAPNQGTTASETAYEVILEQDVEFYGDSVAGQPELFANTTIQGDSSTSSCSLPPLRRK